MTGFSSESRGTGLLSRVANSNRNLMSMRLTELSERESSETLRLASCPKHAQALASTHCCVSKYVTVVSDAALYWCRVYA